MCLRGSCATGGVVLWEPFHLITLTQAVCVCVCSANGASLYRCSDVAGLPAVQVVFWSIHMSAMHFQWLVPACQSFCLSVCQSPCVSVSSSVYLCVCQFICLSLSLSVCLCVCQFVSLSVCLSVQSACLSVCQSSCVSCQIVSLCVSISLSVCLCVCQSVCVWCVCVYFCGVYG